jgi:hypothetical protein
MTTLIRFGWCLCIMILTSLLTQGCFELTSSDEGAPCGDQLACPAPKQCVDLVCISQCIEDADCKEGQACESLRCVPYTQNQEGGEMNQEGGEMNQEGGSSDSN